MVSMSAEIGSCHCKSNATKVTRIIMYSDELCKHCQCAVPSDVVQNLLRDDGT